MSLRGHTTVSGALYPATGVATTTAPGDLIVDMRGYSRCVIRMEAPGSGTSYAYSLTRRSPAPNDGSQGSASAWSTTALASGTVSGTDDEEIVITGDYGDLRLTLSSPSGSPLYLIHYYLSGV